MSSILKKVKSFSTDFVYNFLASVILTGTVQLIVYPLLSRWLSITEYGTLVTIMSVCSIVTGALGTSLNNARLILNSEYHKVGCEGDFNLFLLVMAPFAGIVMGVISLYYFNYPIHISYIIAIAAILMVVKQYYIVEYRLILNYKRVMICNIFGAIGYLFGLLLIYVGVSVWPITFLFSEGIALVYIIRSTKLWREPFRSTKMFSTASKRVLILLVSLIFGYMLTYFDRLMLYSTLGADFVSIYSVSSFFGKSLAIVMSPMSSVLLGYLSQDKVQFDRKKFNLFTGGIVMISFIFALIAVVMSPFFTKVMYPDIFDSAKQFIFIANTASIISVSCNMLQTVILRFSPASFQLIKEGVYLIIYLGLSYTFIIFWGLPGFCLAVLLSNLLKFLIIVIMGKLTFKKGFGED